MHRLRRPDVGRTVDAAQSSVHLGHDSRSGLSRSGADLDGDIEASEVFEFAACIHLDDQAGLLNEGGQKRGRRCGHDRDAGGLIHIAAF
jgi:hypothetical protein